MASFIPESSSTPVPSSSSGRLASPANSSGCNESSVMGDTKFRQSINEMRTSNEMCDVEITVETSTFPTHKLILAACSPYFRAMFRANHFGESQSKEIKIDPKVREKASFIKRPFFKQRIGFFRAISAFVPKRWKL